MKDLHEFHDWFVKRAEMLADSSRKRLKLDLPIPPMFAIFSDPPEGAEELVAFSPVPFQNAQEKELTAHMHQSIAMMSTIKAVLFISESWAIKKHKSQVAEVIKMYESGKSIENHSDRSEILWINGIYKDKYQLVCIYEIDRQKKELSESTIINPQDPHSPIIGRGILPNKGAKH